MRIRHNHFDDVCDHCRKKFEPDEMVLIVQSGIARNTEWSGGIEVYGTKELRHFHMDCIDVLTQGDLKATLYRAGYPTPKCPNIRGYKD